jgi:nitrous oxidase accessory protein NosD
LSLAIVTIASTVASLASASFDSQWAASLAPNTEVELPAGAYAGPWTLAPGVHLTAGPGAVLKGAARNGSETGATLTLLGDARIEGLTIEVTPSGYGVRVGSGKVELTRVHLTARQPSKAAVYVAHGAVVLAGAQIDGPSDYGVLAEGAQRVTLSDTSIRGSRAGIATVSSPTIVEGCTLVGPFSEAAITLIHSAEARLARNLLSAVKTMGIKLLTTTATLSRNRVTGARADSQGLEGNSLYAADSTVTLAADQLGDPDTSTRGPVVLLLHSKVRFEGVRVQGSLQSLVYVAGGSVLAASNSQLEGAPVGLAVESGSKATEAGLQFARVTRHLMQLPP